MKRISTNLPNDDMQHHMRIRQWKMNKKQNEMASQSRITNLRDDPVSAAHSTRFRSHITRLQRFTKNAEYIQSTAREAEGYMQEGLSILQRVRELAVQGSTDTFTKEQKQYMGEEINQLLNELVEIGNARGGDGTTLFSGERNSAEPFRVTTGHVPGGKGRVITGVDYLGNIRPLKAEISEGSYIEASFPGNRVFWAEPQVVVSQVNSTAYQVQDDTSIHIDGVEIPLKQGDNISSVAAKINDADIAVKAKLDPVFNSLVLETTTPHQLWMEDAEGGTVLEDLGILSGNGNLPPQNINPDARISGGSLFDMVIYLRDKLYEGDTIDIGGSGIRGIDSAVDNLLATMADLGSKDERIEMVNKRLAYEIPEMKNRNSREVDVDLAEAITDLKMLEYTHKAALQTASRVLQPTLLDFLR
jgi:flagellar hook-associated protein 3 FlgL